MKKLQSKTELNKLLAVINNKIKVADLLLDANTVTHLHPDTLRGVADERKLWIKRRNRTMKLIQTSK